MRPLPWSVLAVLVAVACGHERAAAPAAARPAPPATKQAAPADEGADDGLDLRLGAAEGPDGAWEALPTPEARPLDEADLQRLLGRLEPLPRTVTAEVALRPGSKPPPRTGATVEVPFPGPNAGAGGPAPEAPPAGPLAVLRWQPEGDLPLAPHVSVTFDRPMVPVTSHAQAAATVPVHLDPQPPGSWRWVGTRTVIFEPSAPRLPMATSYTVSVPADVHALDGKGLAAPFVASFRTPPARLVAHAPGGGATTALAPVVVLVFDQAVDDDAIREAVRVTAGGKPVAVKAASSEAIAADTEARAVARDVPPERLVALVPAAELPAGTPIDVTLPVGTPSAEGPRRTEAAQAFRFATHGPLALAQARCGWSDEPCRPGWPLVLAFTNPLDVDVDLDALVSVAPAVPDLVASVQGDQLVLTGRTAPRTRYRVTVGKALRDVFGQALEAPATATFDVRDPLPSDPSIWAPGGDVQIPDPGAPPVASFAVQGVDRVRVRIARVAPADWAATFSEDRWRRTDGGALPGKVILDEIRPVDGDRDLLRAVDVDLAPHTKDGVGQLLVDVSTVVGTPKDHVRDARVWVDATRIGLSVLTDATDGWVVATDLRTGAPLADVEISRDGTLLGLTDARGVLRAHLDGHALLTARKGDDTALLTPHNTPGPWARWSPDAQGVATAWFVFDDRGMYRPSETVHVKGWTRRVDLGKGGDLLPPEPAGGQVVGWMLQDAQGVELGRGALATDAFGGFAVDLKLPGTPNLGPATLILDRGAERTVHVFQIQEFRRPAFEVSAEVESAGPHVLGDAVVIAAKAAYYAGGGLAGATADWTVTASPTSWDPPGWDDFRFGAWTPWWWDQPFFRGKLGAPEQRWTWQGLTGSDGVDRLRVDLVGVRPARPYTVTASASVQDVDRQAWASSATFLAHPADVYVGLRTARGFYAPGDEVVVDVVVPDLEGAAVAGRPVEVSFTRKRPVWRHGAWAEEDAERHDCAVVSAAAPVSCTVRPEAGGRFELVATVKDAAGRPNRTVMPVWVSGGDEVPRVEGVEQQQVTLVPDRERHEPGQTARILVSAPFAPSTGIVSWRRAGVIHEETIRLEGTSTTIEVPVEEGFAPGVTVSVRLLGAAPKVDAAGRPIPGATRPAWAVGELRLRVPPLFRALDVAVTPAVRAAAPGEDTKVTVAVKGADGRPVAGAQIALVVVDEAVLALSGHTIPDPIDTFHPERDPGALDHDNRPWVRLAAPLRAEGGGYASAEAMDGGAGRALARGALMKSAEMAMPTAAAPAPAAPDAAPIAVRSDFRADALWLPAGLTGADGRLTVPVDLPDSLTRYRITAVAVDAGKRFGRGEADLTVRLPLMVRPSAPRFLNLGDRAELPIVLQNQTDRELVIDVGVRADNATVDGRDHGGRRVRVPAADRVEVRLPVATLRPGTAAFQVAAASGALADAAAFTLPVWTPATTEAFAVTGSLDGPRGPAVLRQPIAAPKDALPLVGGLEITTSTTQLQALTDAVLYLVGYPFACTEQLASRVIAVAALRDVLTAFAADGLPDPEALKGAVNRDVALLARLQNPDGSWGWWRHGERGDPMATLHVTHALVRARAHGFDVPDDAVRRGLQRVADLDPLFDRWWSPEARRVAKAYGVMVRGVAGASVRDDAVRLWRDGGGAEKLPLDAVAWLLPYLPEAERAPALVFLGNRADETASTAQWTTSYTEVDGAVLLHGDHRTDALLLDALLQVDPTSDLLPKVAAGLLAHRVKGAWSSTQENSWVLLALRRYFDTIEGTPPDLVAKVWVGDAAAGEHAFRGRTTERAHVAVPMSWLAAHPDDDVVVDREGAGRLYYRIGLRYAPSSLVLEPAEHGFSVERRYAGVDDPADVRRLDDGSWWIRAGARVAVTLSMVAPAQRYHVALVDPLPAGLEALNPALAVTGDLGPPPDEDARAKGWWWGPWYDHTNLRDERVEAFARYLPAGVWTYRYVARATTPGRFVVPPPKAEEMYAPETFGRGGTDVVVVSAR